MNGTDQLKVLKKKGYILDYLDGEMSLFLKSILTLVRLSVNRLYVLKYLHVILNMLQFKFSCNICCCNLHEFTLVLIETLAVCGHSLEKNSM